MNYTDLEKLNELKTKGIITEAEFNEQKRKILSSTENTNNSSTKINQTMDKDNVIVNNTINVDTKESSKIGILTILGYIFGISMLISGLGILGTGNIMGGIFAILAGIIIVPAFNNLIEKKFKFKLSRTLRIILFIIFVSVYSSTIVKSNNGLTSMINNSNAQITDNKIIDITNTKEIIGKDWEIRIEDINFSQDVQPPVKNTFYTHYQVDDSSNTYLYLVLDCKNISNLDLKANSVASVKVKYNNQYTYNSFSTVPDDTLGFTYSNITNIKPLTSKEVYFLAEMPKSIEDDNEASIDIIIIIDGKTYIYKYR